MFKRTLQIFVVLLFILNVLNQTNSIAANDSSYKTIDSQKSVSPLKAKITTTIVVGLNISSVTLRQILDSVARETAKGVQSNSYPQPVKQSVVYAYLSEGAYANDKESFVGKAFWVVGNDDVEVYIKEDSLKSAHQERAADKSVSTGKPYIGVFGLNGNFITDAVLPFEKEVYDALKKEFKLNPEPDPKFFASDNDWIKACDLVESKCIKKISDKFNINEKTVKDIYFKVGYLKH